VRAIVAGEDSGAVVGTYPRADARGAHARAGGFYGETEFDLAPLASLRSRMAELGRSCIHPAWRTGGTILALWSALGEFMLLHGLDVAFGCASIEMHDGGHAAASLWRQLSASTSRPPARRVRPLQPLALDALAARTSTSRRRR
jgi:putative hemolysin